MNRAILTICLFISVFSYSQIDYTFHLSLIDSIVEYRKVEKKQEIHFYVKEQHFVALKSSVDLIPQSCLKKIELKTLDDLIYLANKERKQIIREGEKEHAIRVLNNDEIFKNLNIYEKFDEKIIRYNKVIWIEEID